MKLWIHIVTVGTSIAQNAITKRIIPEISDIKNLENRLSDPQFMDNVISACLAFVKENPQAASAELNTSLKLLKDGKERGRQQQVYLLHSDTKTCDVCARVLERYLKGLSEQNYKISAKLLKIENLGNEESFEEGLANLFEQILRLAKEHREMGDEVFMHATGGFKPETAIAVLASNIVGIPVFYVHEHFRKIVRIPAMPVSPRRKKRFQDLMNELCRREKVPWEQLPHLRIPREIAEDAIRMGWAEDKEAICISPMGKLLWGKLQKILSPSR